MKVFQRDIDKNKNFGILFAKACLAHYRKLHPRWCTLHADDDISNGLKVEGVYDEMLVIDDR